VIDPTLDHLALGTALAPRGSRKDRRVALIEEGGGTRGAFGAGVQAGFAEAGLDACAFDALYGSSAGALNLMYWVSRRARIGTGVYLDDLTRTSDPRFFLYRTPFDLLMRLARGEPALDVSAVGHAMTRTRPIDFDAVRSHPAPIRIPIARAADLGTDMLDVRTLSKDELMPTLLAGASVPVLADAAELRGSGLFDGAFIAPLPVTQAIAEGCTDLVVILTLPRWKNPPVYEEWILRALASRRKVPGHVARAVKVGRKARRAGIATLRRPPDGIRVTVIAPAIQLARSLEQRRPWIERLVEAGVQAGRLAVDLARIARAT
jgi:predicted patatin/cPLA2 family phospholipase